MSVFTVEKATSKDFERIHPLLLRFNVPRITKADWRKIFTNHWDAPEGFCGYMLLKNGTAKGYLGAIFSRRVIDGEVEKFCNMTSWIVDKDCRGQSLALILELLKLKQYTITNFTPSRNVSAILQKLGFTPIETQQQLVPTVPSLVLKKGDYRCEFDLAVISKKLNDEDLRIFRDHQNFDCEHVLILSGDDYCYLLVKKVYRRRLPFANVHYLSNLTLLASAMDSVKLKICLNLQVVGLVVAERYLNGHQFKHARKYPIEHAAFYKSAKLSPGKIDTLYSEMILLHG